jgi:DNA repair photolyase
MKARALESRNNGTREWAEKTVNCSTGCSHDCVYCYAKFMALRFGQDKEGLWSTERLRQHDVVRKHRRYPGRVMFPSSHDITPTNLSACLQVLENLLVAGNDVLVVSKPHLDSIRAICQQFEGYRDRILFRFTIGAQDDRLLSLFEPNAPGYQERRASLQYAYENGFQTSISVEPLLDSAKIDALIGDLLPFVTDAIWIGKMNYVGRLYSKVGPEVQAALKIIEGGQTDEIIRGIYARHRDNPKIKWKKGIKKIVGIPLAPKLGMDI